MTATIDRTDPRPAGGQQEPAPAEPRSRPPRPKVAWRALLGSTAVITTAAVFLGSVFGGWWPALLLGAECLLILGLALLLQLLRVSHWLSALVIAGLVIAAGYLMMSGAPRVGPDSQVDRPAWRVLLDSVASLLSTPADTPVRIDLVAPAFLLVGLCQAFVVVRAQLRGRTAGPGASMGVAPILVAPIVYGAGQILAAGNADRSGLVAAALVLLVILGWCRLSIPTAGAAAVCAVCATAVTFLSPPAGWDVREYVTPPRIHVDQHNLLPYLPQWQAEQDTAVFEIDGTIPNRISLVVYTGYDGNTWSTGDDFALFGSRRPAALPTGRLVSRYSMQVTPGDIPGDWLPAAGRVEQVSLPDAVQDLLGGSLGRIGQHADPLPYSVSGTIDMIDEGSLLSAGVPDQNAAGDFLQIPELDDPLWDWVDGVVGAYPGRYDQAAALESALRSGPGVDPKGTGSSTLYAIDELVGASSGTPSAGAPAENYVSAFAVLARSIGLPTRVVVGAKLAEVAGVLETSWTVRARDMTVWPEVYFSGVGWVAFNPVPGTGKTPAQKRLEAINTDQPQEDPEAEEELPVTDEPGDGDAALTDAGGGWFPAARTGGLIGAGALALAASAALLAGFALRRRWRRRGAAGAWSAVEQGVRLARIPIPPAWGSDRVADEVGRRLGGDTGARATAVARMAERQRFAPAGTPVPDGAWSDARVVRRELRRSLPWYRRPSWYLRPAAWRAPRSA